MTRVQTFCAAGERNVELLSMQRKETLSASLPFDVCVRAASLCACVRVRSTQVIVTAALC